MVDHPPEETRHTFQCVCGNTIIFQAMPRGAKSEPQSEEDQPVLAMYTEQGTPLAQCPRCGREVCPPQTPK